MTTGEDLGDMVDMLKFTGKIFIKQAAKLGERMKKICRDELDEMPDDYSDAEKVGVIVGRRVGQCIDKVVETAKKYQRTPSGEIVCYKITPRKGSERNLEMESKGENVVTVWEEGKNCYAAVNTRFSSGETFLDAHCKKKTKVSVKHYKEFLRRRENGKK